MEKLQIKSKIAGVGLGGHVGIILIWLLNTYLGVEFGNQEIASIIALCGFGAGWLIKE